MSGKRCSVSRLACGEAILPLPVLLLADSHRPFA